MQDFVQVKNFQKHFYHMYNYTFIAFANFQFSNYCKMLTSVRRPTCVLPMLTVLTLRAAMNVNVKQGTQEMGSSVKVSD